jgi:outer membrane protein assembly factor BamB
MKHTFSATTLALALASFTANADDWTQYRGPNNDGSSSEKLPTKNFGKQPRALWKTDAYPLGFSSFVTEGNTAFTVCARGGKEVLVAVNANNGKQLWSFNIGDTDYGNGGGNAGARNNSGGDGPRSTPSVVDGKVYATSANMGLYCLDAKSGKQLWSHDLLKEFNGVNIKWENAASPLIDGDLVFMAGGGKGQALLAFNKNSGKVAWKTGDDVMTHSTPVVASIHGVRQVIFFTQPGLVGCDVKTGKVLWRYDFNFAVSTAITPIVAGDIVYCSAGYGVGSAAVRIGPGFKVDELWRIHGHKDVANHWSTPVYKDGHLYGMFSFKKYGDGPLKCVELATGKVVWEKEGFGPGNCILIDGSLLALSDDGHVVLAEADSKAYREQSRFKAVSGKCWTTPILANGRIYVRSTTEAACFDVSGRTARR